MIEIGKFGYFWLDTWVMANVIQLATQDFCARFLNLKTDAPACPVCGKPMIKRMAKKGINSGKEFWSCSGYPECNGTRKMT
jgi:ssDNA-binding Zn-finger/Zn-ribbon topoisomerase 1